MKLSVASTTLALALTTSVVAAPTATTQESSLTKRQANIIAQLNEIAVIKRENNLSQEQVIELAQRDYPIVTEILRLLNTDSFAAKFIQKLVDNTTLQPIITSTVEWLIKNNIINLTTLFNALDDSGLAATVIKDIINDCDYYSQIYNLVLSYITGDSSASSAASATATTTSAPQKRDELMRRADSTSVNSAAASAVPTSGQDVTSDSFIDELLNSLAESGLASDLVKRLLVDPEFLKYGVSLIEDLFSSGTLTIGDVIDALTQSTLIPDLFREFFTVDTLQTVITNALAAASGKCDTSATSLNFDPTTRTRTGTATSGTATGTATRTTGGTTSTSTSTRTCRRKRKRSYN